MSTRLPAVHAHHATRNPWGGLPSSSSDSGRTYHCPADCYSHHNYQSDLTSHHTYSQPARTPSPHYDVIDAPRLLNRLAAPVSRPVSAASTAHTEGAVDPCGGHCTTLENFCHYCLQILFIAGILTGISLTIAGSVLRGQKRGGDLMVLVYIGCLTAMVCALLLSVQCCVRRNVNRRKRARRGVSIPLQDLAPTHGPLAPPVLPTPGQYEPLLRRLVQQQIDQRQLPQETIVNPMAIRGDRSGTPWWRRQPPHPSKIPHSHVQMPL